MIDLPSQRDAPAVTKDKVARLMKSLTCSRSMIIIFHLTLSRNMKVCIFFNNVKKNLSNINSVYLRLEYIILFTNLK